MPANAPEPWDVFARESRFDRGLRLTRTALEVVRADRTLVWLGVLVLVGFGVAVAAYVALSRPWRDDVTQLELLLWTLVLVFPATFASVFASTAVVAAAAAKLDGAPITVRQALAVPLRRLDQVLLWSLLSAGVGYVIDQLVSRIPWGGALLSWLSGAAWSLVTMFAVPVLVFEGCRGPACVKRSARIVRDAWGEGVTGNVMLGALSLVVFVPAALVLVVGFVVAASSVVVGVVLIALAALAMGLAVAVTALARDVFALVLYRYAIDGIAAGGFHEDDLARFAVPRHSMFRRARGG